MYIVGRLGDGFPQSVSQRLIIHMTTLHTQTWLTCLLCHSPFAQSQNVSIEH